MSQSLKIVAAVMFLLVVGAAFGADPIVPDPKLTPGDVLPGVTKDQICQVGYTKAIRHVSGPVKARVYKEYGIERTSGYYDIDHLISLQLGGSNDIKNLWPESIVTQPWNSAVKNELEDHLHKLVCEGSISLEEAQRAIATDWIAAYQKYIGPAPSKTP